MSKKFDYQNIYDRWSKLVNMTYSEIRSFYLSKEGKTAGIGPGRKSARALMRMKLKNPNDWSENDWQWARRQISFISRMKKYRDTRGMKPKFEKNGIKTRWYKSLLIWGHDPKKRR